MKPASACDDLLYFVAVALLFVTERAADLLGPFPPQESRRNLSPGSKRGRAFVDSVSAAVVVVVVAMAHSISF